MGVVGAQDLEGGDAERVLLTSAVSRARHRGRRPTMLPLWVPTICAKLSQRLRLQCARGAGSSSGGRRLERERDHTILSPATRKELVASPLR